MKQSDEGFALSYNAQISADAVHGLIVGVAVTDGANDTVAVRLRSEGASLRQIAAKLGVGYGTVRLRLRNA